MWELNHKEGWVLKKLMLLNCGVGEDSWESLGLQGDPTSPFWRRSVLVFFGRSDAKAEIPVLWPPDAKKWLFRKRPWCQERLKAGGEGDDIGWDGWTVSLTQWTWVWVSSGSWWWTGKPGMLQSMGSKRVGHNWATELKFQGLSWRDYTVYTSTEWWWWRQQLVNTEHIRTYIEHNVRHLG